MSVSRVVAANTKTFSGALPDVFEAVKSAGFDAIEVWKDDIFGYPGGANAISELLENAGLKAPAFQLLRDYEGCGSGRSARLAEAEGLLDMMSKMGAQTLLVCATTQDTASGIHGEQIADLRELADLAASRGMRVGFEPLAWSRWINNYDRAWACVEAVDHDAFGLVLDVFHLFSRGTSLTVIDKILMEKLFLVQLSNARPTSLPTIEVARHHRLFPSDGNWPVKDVIRRLEDRQYQGPYSLEVFNDTFRDRNPFELAKTAWNSFNRLFDSLKT